MPCISLANLNYESTLELPNKG